MKRPREIIATAVVVLLGSVLSVLAGILVAASAWLAFHKLQQQYPGVTLKGPNPDLPLIKEAVVLAVVIPVVLGLIGIATARGLLRLKAWARVSVLTWCVATSLFCIGGVVWLNLPGRHYISFTAFILPMLVLFPINAWWMLVLLRPSTRALFAKPGSTAYRLPTPAWLRKNFVSKTIIGVAAILLVAIVGGRLAHGRSDMSEIERSRDALATVKSWHYHSVRYIPGLPPETREDDFVCPTFHHTITSTGESSETPDVREGYRYFSTNYARVGNQWVSTKSTGEIIECQVGPIGADQNSMPISAVIDDGSVRRGDLKDVDGESCREYSVSVPTPHDPQEKDFQFTICINEQDHFPRETRRTPPDWTRESVSHYTKWNAVSADLPPEIQK